MPWQLYPPLVECLAAQKIPAGVYHLKRFRPKDSELREFLGDQLQHKPTTIAPILTVWPERQFIIDGDSGEQDPEN